MTYSVTTLPSEVLGLTEVATLYLVVKAPPSGGTVSSVVAVAESSTVAVQIRDALNA